MTVVQETVVEAPVGTPDGPMLAHVSEQHFYEDGQPLIALCGTGLIGMPILNPPHVCQECLDVIEEAFGDRHWPRPDGTWDFLPSWKEKHA